MTADAASRIPAATGGATSSGLSTHLVGLVGALRGAGMRVGTAELLDAVSATSELPWTSEVVFKEALATCLAKSRGDRAVFDVVFDRYFFFAGEGVALEKEPRDPAPESAPDQVANSESLRDAILDAAGSGRTDLLLDLARLAASSFDTPSSNSGVVGVDVQRIRRALGLTRVGRAGDSSGRAELQPDPRTEAGLRTFDRLLRRELERARGAFREALPEAKPLRDLDRALPTNPLGDLASIHRVVSVLRRRLATEGRELRGRTKSSHVDIRRTMRASLETGGVPLQLKFRPKRPRRPEIYVICDVSTSVSSASVFFLSVLHALHESFRKLRSFVFVERISEVTDVFDRERDFKTASERISAHGGVADLSGYTDYGRVWGEFLEKFGDDLDSRSTVIVMGDARTNGREPRVRAFGQISSQAGRTFWLNPEPRLYWNYGDSVMSLYESACDGVFECWTAKQLETFVKALARTGAA